MENNGGWFPLHQHDMHSFLDGLSKAEQMAGRIKSLGYSGGALTNHGNLCGVPAFFKTMKKAGLKPVAGIEWYVCSQDARTLGKDNGPLTHLVCVAKNKQGWENMVKASSASNAPDRFYRKPRLDLKTIGEFAGGEFIAFSGHMGSALADACFTEPKASYSVRSVEEARQVLAPDAVKRVCNAIEEHVAAFGKDNFYAEVQLIDSGNLPASVVCSEVIREAARLTGTPCVATADSHYVTQDDASDQRVLLCSSLRTTMKKVYSAIERGDDVQLGAFFRSRNYHIPSHGELVNLHTGEELRNALLIAERCEDYDISRPPMLPDFPGLNGTAPHDRLRELCREGWRKKLARKIPREKHALYGERLESEMAVLTEFNLCGYMLVMQDIIRYSAEELGCVRCEGRGSSSGSLVAYLSGITGEDPVANGLMFERFINAGRLSKERASLPDIDTDFPIHLRGQVVQYVRDKYGSDRVGQISTFSRLQGRGALKEVFRVHDRLTQEEAERVTGGLPSDAAISDDLQEMQEAFEKGERESRPSVIRWALENTPERLREWCWLEGEEYCGPLAKDFEQAVRLEGVIKSSSKHASAVVIASEPVADLVPMVRDKSSDNMMAGLDKVWAEALGLVKLDILGSANLSSMGNVRDDILEGIAG